MLLIGAGCKAKTRYKSMEYRAGNSLSFFVILNEPENGNIHLCPVFHLYVIYDEKER